MRWWHATLALGWVLLMVPPARSGDARLTIAGVKTATATVDLPRPSEVAEAPGIDLVWGRVDGSRTAVTVPQAGLHLGREPRAADYPRYELAGDAVGVLEGSGAAARLQIDGQLWITWRAGTSPELFEVKVVAESPAGVPAGGDLEIRVEAWRAGVDRAGRTPTISATLSGLLE